MDKKNDWDELEQWNSLREEEQKNRYIIGTIGALIGAFIEAKPWI